MAMEVASGVVGEAAKSCFALAMAKIKKEWSYIWRYNDNMNDLREKRAELETLKRQIEGEVEARERKREMIGPLADEMLRDVEAFLADDEWSAFMDENKIKKKDKCCFGVLHCNLTYRYRISKRATTRFETTRAKIKKMEDCKSRAVTLPGKPPELGSMPTAHSKSLASRESTLNEIMEALKDKEVHRIGIYGMGGIGKTTLIEEVARRAEAEGLFKVVIAEVSQAPDILKMQQQIAERIDLPLKDYKSEGERARIIYEVLKKLYHKEEKEDNQMSKKRTTQALVILDNMWKKLDLDKVGIPHDCKIALTTRSEDVCREMEANKKFGLQGLNDTEATELFLEKARPSADHGDGYKSVTDELVKKCGGLPLAIVALANTLRDRNLSDWKHVADQLGKTVSARVGGPMEENVHPILKWSYNSISNKEKKKFFLLCCLFPLGSSIAIQDLMRYGAGLDLFQYMNSLGEAIEQAHSWATELKSSSLLLEADDEQNVRIHDIVREALLSIAVKGDNIFHIGSVPRWITKETFQTFTAISMTSEDNHETLSRFEFPKLEILLLKGSLESKFSDNFFQGMNSLKVLAINSMKFQTLPSSITQLNNLRTLNLEYCELSDIFAIVSLVDLLFLSLYRSEIHELPKELEKLEKLKMLDLTGCLKLQKIPAGVIARLTNLEGLYMMESFREWRPNNFESSSKKDELDDNKEMASLIELKSLSSLTVLEMHVPKIYLLPHNLLFPHLSRFSISIGYEAPPCDNIHSKLLFLGEIDARRPLPQCITFLLKETEHLSLQRISGLKNVVNSLDKDGFRNLKCLFVECCSDMEYIVTGNELNEDGGAFPKLETLNVEGEMDNLKVICHGPPSHYSFHHLKVLTLYKLGGLRNFCDDHDMDNNQSFFNEKMKFPTLEELEIRGVGGIVELWNLSDVEEDDPAFPRLVNLSLWNLPELRSIWRSKDIVIHRSFRSLKSLEVSVCPKLEILCPFSMAKAFKQLETVDVYRNDNMKEIIAKETGEMKNNDTEMTIFPELRNIELKSLSNLKCFFGGNIKLVFPSLKSIDCDYLDEMVAFVSSEYPGDSGALFNEKVKFPGLEELRISNVGGIKELWNLSYVEEEVPTFPRLVHLEVDSLPEMRSIWMSNDVIIHHIFQNLKNLTVRRCPKLEILCPFSVAAGLEQLETLTVENNENMKEIIAKETGELKNNDTGMTVFPKLRNMKLQSLSNLQCFFGGSIKLVFPSLESINFSYLKKMVTFVSSEYPRDSDALFNDKVALPAIKEINISGVNGPKEIWSSHLDARSFNELKTLEVFNVEKDTKVFALDTIKQMRNLKELNLYGFQLAEELIERIGFYNDGIENSASLLPQLRKLTMNSFPLLKRIPWRELALQDLRYLKICQVKGLTYLFSASVGRRLVNLEELDVSDCQMMEEIVGRESGDTNTVEVNVVFPRLNILRLCDLPTLQSLSSDNVIIKFPSIIKVKFQQFQNPIILLDLLQKFQHVKELILGRCEALLEPFDLERRASAIPPRLGKLTLSNMSKLQMIPWKIFPIENLHYLKISHIHGLKFLFPASLGSKGFAQLEEICIEYCKDIEHVLAPESIEDTSNNPAPIKVVLPRVKFIDLNWLSSLRSFSSDSYKDLEFPSLELVWINECPMVETFSHGSLSTPRLRNISINWIFQKKHLDLNAVIKNRTEEEMSGEDTETQSIEGETSQGVEEETSGIDTETEVTWWRRKFEVYYQYFENWTELFGLILYPLLGALVIILMIWIFIRAFKIDADPSTKSMANSNPLFKGNEL